MSSDLLDASAVLAIIRQEKGADQILHLVPGASTSSVNAAEVLKKLIDAGLPAREATSTLDALQLEVIPFGITEARHSADFIHPGISLGDRACLGTAQVHGLRVVTADATWTTIRRKVRVLLFRGPAASA